MTNHSRQDEGQKARNVFIKIIKEPLLQFFCIGLLLFTLDWLINGYRNASVDQDINITAGQVEQLAEQFHLVAGRMPDQLELEGLLNNFIDEEIAYREALALGLDSDDTIVRRRMRQKLEFLAMDMQVATNPTDSDLLSWLEAHMENYQQPERISFRHIFASKDSRDKQAKADALSFYNRLNADPQTKILGDDSMLPNLLSLATEKEIASLFGDEFARSAILTPANIWSHPIKSAYGYHLINITERQPAYTPSLDDLRETLTTDWTRAAQQEARDKYFKQLRNNYFVHIDWPINYKKSH